MNPVVNSVKKLVLVAVTFSVVLVAGQINASCNKTTAHRIEPVGSVCVEGEECKADAVEVVEAPKGPRSGEEIVGDYCAGCHATGVMNAPIAGGSFKALGSKGMASLLKVAKKGKNAMPRMGGCGDCSDEELTSAIQNMLDQ